MGETTKDRWRELLGNEVAGSGREPPEAPPDVPLRDAKVKGPPLPSVSDEERAKAKVELLAIVERMQKNLNEMPAELTRLETDDALDALIESVERALRDESYPERVLRMERTIWNSFRCADAEDCRGVLERLERAKERANG